MYLAAPSTGGQILGTIGVGGLGLFLLLLFVLGTREASRHKLTQGKALTVCLVAGVVWMSAGQIWGMPDDLIAKALTATQRTDALGDVGLGAISASLVLVAYLVTLRPRAAGYLGIVMATTFSQTGGGWAMLTAAIADTAVSWA